MFSTSSSKIQDGGHVVKRLLPWQQILIRTLFLLWKVKNKSKATCMPKLDLLSAAVWKIYGGPNDHPPPPWVNLLQ